MEQIRILKSEELTKDVKLLTFDFSFPKFTPGQFYMIDIPGFGKCPLGIMQSKCSNNKLQALVRTVGDLTEKINSLKKNDYIYIHGPYGNGFPISELKKKNILMIAGGIGIVPIKSLLDYISENKGDFENIQLMYGAKTPVEIFFQKEINKCEGFGEMMLSAEKNSQNWGGNIGLVTSMINSKTVESNNCIAVLCGPPIMYKAVIEKLNNIGFSDKSIFISMEKRMRCGVGKCQHCTCGDKYACTDGPVFRYDETLKFPEGL